MPDVETFGARIKRLRLAASLTQRQLAEKTGVGVPHISKVESDRENPSDELIVRLARVLGADADELFLTARRLSPELAEEVASNPTEVMQFLRTMRNDRGGS